MNKKFFTLLVAFLATMSFGAFAQTLSFNGVNAGTAFSSTKQYMLKATNGQFLAMIPTANGLKLVTIDLPTATTGYQTLRQASWTVRVYRGTGAESPTYELTNVASGERLSLASANAKDATTKYSKDLNIVEGDMDAWISNRVQLTAGPVKLFWSVPEKSQVNGLALSTTTPTGLVAGQDPDVVALYDGVPVPTHTAIIALNQKTDGAGDPTVNFVQFDWFQAAGTLALNPNDLNTMFQRTGVAEGGQLVANKDSYFSLDFKPENTVPNPFTGELQARAVERWEIAYGMTGDEAGGAGISAPAPNTPVDASGFYSMYPEGTTKDSKKNQDNIVASARNTTAGWYALYSKDADKYLVVDTNYVKGTDQFTNSLIEIATDDLYNAKNNTRYRYPNSYLFKFIYNASDNSIQVMSAGYVEKVEVRADDKQRVKTTTNNATYYGAYATTNPVLKGSNWPNGTYESDFAAAQPVVTQVPDPNYGTSSQDQDPNKNRVLLTFAQLTEATIVYTLGKQPHEDFTVFLGTSREYMPVRLTTGVYTLKVVSSDDKSREGKYLKRSLTGHFEYVQQATRQNFADMPSAQWVVITTGTSTNPTSTFINREFPENEDPTIMQDYLMRGTPYRRADNGANEFFLLGGDVYQYEKVDGTNEYVGYKYLKDADYDLFRYEFKYLHELQMDRPVNTKATRDSAVWVEPGEGSVTFTLEKVTDDTYGYYNASYKNSVKELVRGVYKAKVHTASNFDFKDRYLAYDAKNKKYYLSQETSSNFFLKENNEVKNGEVVKYYILLEANVFDQLLLAKVPTAAAGASVGDGTAGKFVTDYDLETKYEKKTDSGTEYQYGYYYATEQYKKDENGLPKKTWMPKLIVTTNNLTTFAGVAAEFGNPSDTFKEFMQLFGLTNTQASFNFFTTYARPIAGTVKELKEDNTETAQLVGYYIAWTALNPNYASSKVAVDNNTLDLVNGVIADDMHNEVNNSAFSVEPSTTELYRTLGKLDGEEKDINIVKFFRTNSDLTGREYLYEDAHSVYSDPANVGTTMDNQLNFLGVEGKGMTKKSAMKVRYTSGDIMPQYLISVGEVEHEGTEGKLCEICGLEDCDHSIPAVEGYITGRFLVNLTDSVKKYTDKKDEEMVAKFKWEAKYTRLAFVPAQLTLDGKTLTVLNDPKVYDVSVNQHSPVLFSFRLLEDGTTGKYDFLIESESWKDDKPFADKIAPKDNGGWVKIQNGVPVIVNAKVSGEAYAQAERFNLEVTTENPTSNESIVENGKVTVTAGEGYVVVKGAAGKQVVVANVLGQVVANQVLTSDEATIAAPAGVVVVSVDGTATKALVK